MAEIVGHQRLTPVILAIHKAEIRRIMVRSQREQIVHKILSQK
jgi:EAL domain-containing protein (putative c-di-GMP-specific phosphodiesterase class I)